MGPQNTAELLPMIGRIGGNAALEIIKDQLKMSENVNIAVRALCNWPNAVVADDLLAIAENARMSDQNKIAALRAFARVISLRDEEIGIRISGKNKVAKLRKGMGLATRVEEKRLILDRTAAVRDVDSIKFALEYIDDNDLQQNACRTIIDIAHHDNMRRPNKELFGPALDKVIERIKDNGQKERAQRYRANM
ncbi:MAG TPA: hypothetical protein DEB39_09775 [Planctomycetaceae bacterium]|nr:hypothetical protein [Planctomycetaceae bacterium]